MCYTFHVLRNFGPEAKAFADQITDIAADLLRANAEGNRGMWEVSVKRHLEVLNRLEVALAAKGSSRRGAALTAVTSVASFVLDAMSISSLPKAACNFTKGFYYASAMFNVGSFGLSVYTGYTAHQQYLCVQQMIETHKRNSAAHGIIPAQAQ